MYSGERALHDINEDFQTPSEALLMKVLEQVIWTMCGQSLNYNRL